MEPKKSNGGAGGYGGNGGYGSYGGYPQKPVSVLWAKVRIQVRRYSEVLSRLFWVLPLTTGLGVCLAAWVVSQMPADYISEARMMVSGTIQYKADASFTEETEFYYGTQTELMRSLEVRKGALARVQTLHPDYVPEEVTLSVSQVPHASMFILTVEGQSAKYAQAYLDAIMDEFIDQKRKLRLQKSDATTLAIQDQLASLEKDMENNDTAMHDFQKQNNIGFLQQEGNDAAVYLAQKKRELADLKIEYNLLQLLDLDQNLDRARANASSGSTAADGTTKPDAENLADTGPVADYQKAKQQLELLKAHRADLAKRLRPAHPDMMAIDQQIEKENALIETLRSQSVEALKTRRDSIQIQIQNLEGVITEWEAKALDLSGRISEFDRIKTKADRAKEEYARLLSSKDGVTETKNIDQDSIMISEHASEGQSVKPGWGKIVLAGITGGLLVGVAILFCVEQMDDRIGSFIELQTHFQETILGQIPRQDFSEDPSLLRHIVDRLPLLVSFRSLRSSLIFFPVEGATRPKTLVVTSAVPNEGKTTISANLAITLAFSGARTLVVDADMRRGRLSHLFGVTEGSGLSSVLLKTVPWREAVHQTTVENLSLISCGPPLKHPAEHLLGKVADNFLKEVYEQFDYVIFDSPPVTLLDDTLSLAPKIDGVLVVVRFGVSAIRSTRRTLDLLAQRQANIMGLICNDVRMSESEYNYGYYYSQTLESYHKDGRATV